MTTERINIVVTERGSRVVKRSIQAIGTSAVSATRGLRTMQNALFVLGGAGLLRSLVKNVDTLNSFRNRLKLVTRSTEELNKVQKELFDISNRTRTAFATTATVFTRTAFNTKELGLSMKDTLAFTEALNKAVLISGANAREAEAATIQLSQAIASDRFSGDELRSVLEQLPFAADVIAKGVNATRGQLRQMGKEGKITAEKIIEAFLSAAGEIDGLFGRLNITIGQSFDILSNKFLEFLGNADQITGFSDKIVGAVLLIGDNLDSIIPTLVAVGAAFAARFLGPMLAGLAKAAVAEARFAKSVLLGTSVLIKGTAANQARAASQSASVAQTLAATEAQILKNKTEVSAIQLSMASTRAKLQQNLQEMNLLKLNNSRAVSVATLNKLEATRLQLERGLLINSAALNTATNSLAVAEGNLARVTALNTTFLVAWKAAMVGATIGARVLAGAMLLLTRGMALLGGPFGLLLLAATAWMTFGGSTDVAAKATRTHTEELISLNRELRESVGLSEKLREAKMKEAKAELANLRDNMFAAGRSVQFLSDQINKSRTALAELKTAAQREQKDNPNSLLPKKAGLAFTKESERLSNLKNLLVEAETDYNRLLLSSDRLENSMIHLSKTVKENLAPALEKLKGKLNAMVAANQQVKKVETLLALQVKKGNIDKAEANKLLERQKFLLKEQLAPFKSLVEELKFENSLAGLSNDEREIEISLRKKANDLILKGRILTTGEIADLKELLKTQQENNKLRKEKRPKEDRAAAFSRNLDEIMTEANALGVLGDQRKVIAAQLKIEANLRKVLRDKFPKKSEQEIINLAKLSGAEEKSLDILVRRVSSMERLANTVEGIFADAKSSIVDFANTGKLSIGSLFDSIQQRITQLAADQLFEQLFGLLGSSGGKGLMGAIFGGVGSLVGIPGSAHGNDFAVAGMGGVDTNTLSINGSPVSKVSRGETVSIVPKGGREQGGQRPITVSVHVQATDANSFQSQETQNQIAQGVGQAIQRATGRDN